METVGRERKKNGRPPKAIKKEVRASARFTRHEYLIVRGKASQAGMNISGYIRWAAISGKITPRLNAEEMHIVRQLVGMSANINQVAKVCHREGMYEAMMYFERYRDSIDALLKKLRQ